ncbi:MAG: alanine--glyoxylate aminotransferase family protein [Lewinellaceae bacterium]|nr:alanine--glyoxylate aminotransferase family protein [Lewinellaceae bacterium]
MISPKPVTTPAPAFAPPQRKLMGPGPSDIYPEVLAALSRPTVGHLDPEFVRMMDELRVLTQYAFQTDNRLTMVVSAPGSAGMETCFVNLVEAGDQVIVCRNGVFGGRMVENVERCGGIPIVVDFPWGSPVDPNKVEDALKSHPEARILAFVHAETSTGARSDAQTLCALAQQYNCLTIVDAVTSLAGVPVLVDEWGIDAIYSGSQKCLSCVPGLSPVSLSERAVARIQQRKNKVQSWFLDLSLVMQYWGDGLVGSKRSYHHTAPVNTLYAMHEALRILQTEGLENSWNRHQRCHERLRDGLEALGFRYLVDIEYRLPQLNAVFLPAGVTDEANLRRRLLDEFNLEVGSGLGDLSGKIWRIGLMGYSARPENVDFCLDAIGSVLS